MRQHNWLLGIVGLCLTAGCASKLASTDSSPPVDLATQPDPSQAAVTQPLFPDPLIASSTVQASVIPNLIPPTSSSARIPQIESGRPDPFASLGMTPTVVKVRPPQVAVAITAAAPPGIAAPAPVNSIAPLPRPAVFPLPPLLPAAATLPPIGVGMPGLPPIAPARSRG